jgi:hypothetical protein
MYNDMFNFLFAQLGKVLKISPFLMVMLLLK